MRRLLQSVSVFVAFVLLCALATTNVNAQDNPSRFESVDIFIDVRQNGDMLIQETYAYSFQRESISFTGFNVDMEHIDHIDQVSVAMDGLDLPVETDREERTFTMAWKHVPVTPPQTRTFVLSYRVRGGLHLGEEQDAVVWDAVPGNRGEIGDIDRATVTVRLPPTVSGQILGFDATGGETYAEQPDPRTVQYTLPEGLPGNEELTVRLFFTHGLVDAPTPNWKGDYSWLFKQTFLKQERLVSLLPAANWARATDVLYWSLRFSVFGLVIMLFIVCRVRKSRWPAADFPEVSTVTTLPSNLPAPVVSVLGSRKITPQTYLSILLDMLQKGNLTITAVSGYDTVDTKQQLHSQVNFVRQFEPHQPWEKVVYDALPSDMNNSEVLKSHLERQRRTIRAHLDEYLLSRGTFDGPPLQVMADQGQGPVARFGWFLAAIILATGVGLWVHLWLPWWAGAAIGIPAALGFFAFALDHDSGRLLPTSAGAFEISRWYSFSDSLFFKRVGPTLDPSQPDPLLPYSVALNRAEQWVNDIDALPPWFLPGGTKERTREGLYAAYFGFIGADSWELLGGPSIKSSISRGGGGGGGGGDGGGGQFFTVFLTGLHRSCFGPPQPRGSG